MKQSGELLATPLLIFANNQRTISEAVTYDHKYFLCNALHFFEYIVIIVAKNGHFDLFWDPKCRFAHTSTQFVF